MPEHKCNAGRWAYMIRYGCPTECDPFDARESADAEIASEGLPTALVTV